MSLQGLARTLRHMVHVEYLIAGLRLKLGLRRMAYGLLAGLAFVIAFIMFNVAGYEWLKTQWGPVLTPLFVGAANLALAALAALLAATSRHGREFAMALEVRQSLADQLDDELRRRAGLGGRILGASEIGVIRILIPVIATLFGVWRKKSNGKAGPAPGAGED
jgi:hypothetical protein